MPSRDNGTLETLEGAPSACLLAGADALAIGIGIGIGIGGWSWMELDGAGGASLQFAGPLQPVEWGGTPKGEATTGYWIGWHGVMI